jgi:hypothetical protein
MHIFCVQNSEFFCVKTGDTYNKPLCFKRLMGYWKWERKGSEKVHWSVKAYCILANAIQIYDFWFEPGLNRKLLMICVLFEYMHILRCTHTVTDAMYLHKWQVYV